jgi:ubiquinone/menaquinone biosynthesis C-methylase UbiE
LTHFGLARRLDPEARDVPFPWPEDFSRVPDEDWTEKPVETLAKKYDTVEQHGWYSNLERTVEQLLGFLEDGMVLIDYSGGTGILAERLLRNPSGFGVVIVDASPKFLRLALQKLGGSDRVAFRWLPYFKDRRRLAFLDEVLSGSLLARGAEAIASTNAIHLYYDLPDTLASWARVLRPGGQVFVQSGNIRNPAAGPGEVIIDETVEAIHEAASRIAMEQERFAPYRAVLSDRERMATHASTRRKYFLPARPLDYYLEQLARAGLTLVDASYLPVEAEVAQWHEFLATYHEGVLGWVTDAETGAAASGQAVLDRLDLMRSALASVFEGRTTFLAGWTYLVARKP